MEWTTLIAILSALAVGHALFLAVYLWQFAGGRRLPNRLLSLLLLALALRIGKSVILSLFPDANDAWPGIALVGLMAIGPFLWMYVRSASNSGWQWGAAHALHFLPALLIAVLIPFLTGRWFFWAYVLGNTHMLAYGLAGWWETLRKREQLSDTPRQWLSVLCLGLSFIWLVFTSQLFTYSQWVYVAVTGVAAAALYGLSFWVLRRGRSLHPKESSLQPGEAEVSAIGRRIRQLFLREKLYTDSNLTVSKLAGRLREPSYLVSKAINVYFEKSFPELLHEYRIEEARRLLKAPEASHLSIEAIAYDSGFNSLSAFYSAFKKINQQTPAEYRRQFAVGSGQ